MKMIAKRCSILSLIFMFLFMMQGFHVLQANAEEEIGRSNIGKWNGGTFYEYMTKEFVREDDQSDTITYRIRYRLKHWGSWYTYQVTPINLFINDQYITTFTSGINVRVANEDRVNGVFDVTMKKGVTNKMELRDTGVSITVINVEGLVYAPLPTYQVTFMDGYNHLLKSEKVTKYESATPPSTPFKDGYAFSGWDKPYTNITSNTVINATWRRLNYTLRISPNGGEWNNRFTDTIYQDNAGVKRDLPNPKREGYVFDGWTVEGLGLLDGYVKQYDHASSLDVIYAVSTIANGWQPQARNATYNTLGNIEALRISLGNSLDSFFSVQYRAYCQDIGWLPWVRDDAIAGKYQAGKRMEAVEIRIDGALSMYYDIEYRVNVDGIGWMSWVSNGQSAGVIKQDKAIQCIQMRLQRKKSSIPTNHTFYGLSGNANVIANWLPLPYMEVAYDRWFLVQEDIKKEDILQVVKAYDEYHRDISNTITMEGFEQVIAKKEGDYTVHLRATSQRNNTCEAKVIIHVVDKLTRENIRGIAPTQMDYLDSQSKWQNHKDILKQKITQQDCIASFNLKR